jgi:hypothetical protein
MNNCYYKGSVVNGLFSGGGTIILSNGNKYEGEFKDGKPNGKGILTLANGNKYIGQFKDGKLNGKATITVDGIEMICEYKEGEILKVLKIVN